MKRTVRRHPLGWLSPFLIIALSAAEPRFAAAAQNDAATNGGDVTLAEQKAAEAFEAYGERRYTEAVALYTEAYAAAPNADILFNIARIYDTKLGDRPLAINFYRRYIVDPGAVPERIQLANERLLALRDAELAASRPTPPTAPAEPAAATSSGTPQPASPEPPSAHGPSGTEVLGVILGTTGLIALGVGAGFGVAAMSDARTVRDLCDGNVCREQRGIDAAESARDHAFISTVGFASGGALLALGAAVYFLLGDQPRERPEQVASGGLRLEPRVTTSARGGVALELGGSW